MRRVSRKDNRQVSEWRSYCIAQDFLVSKKKKYTYIYNIILHGWKRKAQDIFYPLLLNLEHNDIFLQKMMRENRTNVGEAETSSSTDRR